jgi:hypothetical protein
VDISPLEIVKVLNFKTIALVRAIKFDNLTIECEEIWLSSGVQLYLILTWRATFALKTIEGSK